MKTKYDSLCRLIFFLIAGILIAFESNALAQIKAAIWEHGNIVVAENPVISMKKWGWGTTIKQNNSSNWFHFNISTPVLLDGVRSPLKKIFVFFNASPSTKITQIDVWDGARLIKTIDNLSITGDHSKAIDEHNSWIIDQEIIYYGLGLSVHVTFGNDGEITFTSAGTDFGYPTGINVSNTPKIIESYSLKQNYPNPFNAYTIIEYQLNTASFVNIGLYNIKGEEVDILTNKYHSQGTHYIQYDASDLSSGVYFYKLIVNAGAQQNNSAYTETRKLMIMK